MVLAERGSPDGWLAANPHVGGWLVAPLDGARRWSRRSARAAAALVVARAEIARRCAARATASCGSASRSRPNATSRTCSRRSCAARAELTRADSGSLFLLEDGPSGERVLRFAVAQTGPADAGMHLGAVLPLSRSSISGYVALSGEIVRIDDAYEIPGDAEYRFNPQLRQANGYRTKSVLAVPMRDHENEIVGVIMLINRKPEFATVLASPAHTEAVVRTVRQPRRAAAALAGLAGRRGAREQSLLESIQRSLRAVRDRLGQGDRGAATSRPRATRRASPS